MITIHYCHNKELMLPLSAIGWTWDERPLNNDVHETCPYCEIPLSDESVLPATQEQIDVLNLHNVGQEKVELLQ